MISEWNPDEDEFTGSEINEVELFYADGDVCDITGKPREVVVRLKVKIYFKKFLNVGILSFNLSRSKVMLMIDLNIFI